MIKITQLILSGNEAKIETPIERLLRARKDYFIELLQEIDNCRNKRIDLIKSYKNTVYDIDKNIQREQWRMKQK